MQIIENFSYRNKFQLFPPHFRIFPTNSRYNISVYCNILFAFFAIKEIKNDANRLEKCRDKSLYTSYYREKYRLNVANRLEKCRNK